MNGSPEGFQPNLEDEARKIEEQNKGKKKGASKLGKLVGAAAGLLMSAYAENADALSPRQARNANADFGDTITKMEKAQQKADQERLKEAEKIKNKQEKEINDRNQELILKTRLPIFEEKLKESFPDAYTKLDKNLKEALADSQTPRDKNEYLEIAIGNFMKHKLKACLPEIQALFKMMADSENEKAKASRNLVEIAIENFNKESNHDNQVIVEKALVEYAKAVDQTITEDEAAISLYPGGIQGWLNDSRMLTSEKTEPSVIETESGSQISVPEAPNLTGGGNI